MANERIPNDPYRSPSEPYRPGHAGDDLRDPARLDNELQPDPELAEGAAGGGRIAMLAVAVALVLGVVFYGLNSSSIHQAATSPAAGTSSTADAPPARTAEQTTSPAAPPGMRDVTPHANTGPGVTTGAAPARPQTPPSDTIPPNK